MSEVEVSEALSRIAGRGDLELLNDLITITRSIEESKDPKVMAKALRISAASAISLVPTMMLANTAREFAKDGKAMLDGAVCGVGGDSLAKNKGSCTKDQHLKIVRMAGDMGWDL